MGHPGFRVIQGKARVCGGSWDRLEPVEGAGALQAVLDVALEGFDGEAAEVGDAGWGPVFGGEVADGAAEDSQSGLDGGGRERGAARAAVVVAGDAVAGGGVPDLAVASGWATADSGGTFDGGAAAQRCTADDAVAKLRHPAHEAIHPETKVGYGEPDAVDLELGKGGEREAEDGVLGGLLGEGLFEDLGDKLESGGAGVIDGLRERRGEDLEGVEADEFLTGALGIAGADVGHGLECAAEALTRAQGVAGDTLDAALIAREEADEQVGLEEGPGAQNDGFADPLNHAMPYLVQRWWSA